MSADDFRAGPSYFVQLKRIVVDKCHGGDRNVQTLSDGLDALAFGIPVYLGIQEVLAQPEFLQLFPCRLGIILAGDAEEDSALVQLFQQGNRFRRPSYASVLIQNSIPNGIVQVRDEALNAFLLRPSRALL